MTVTKNDTETTIILNATEVRQMIQSLNYTKSKMGRVILSEIKHVQPPNTSQVLLDFCSTLLGLL